MGYFTLCDAFPEHCIWLNIIHSSYISLLLLSCIGLLSLKSYKENSMGDGILEMMSEVSMFLNKTSVGVIEKITS